MPSPPDRPPDRPIEWVGSSLKDLSSFPVDVKRDVGFALRAAQQGKKSPAAKPLTGEPAFKGSSVLEIVDDHDGDTYRAVYTVRFAEAVYVLHAFQKKSTKGIATPRREIEKIKRRLDEATRLHAEKFGKRDSA